MGRIQQASTLPDPITPLDKMTNAKFVISVTVILIVTFSVFALAQIDRRKELALSDEVDSRKKIAHELEEAKNIAEQAALHKTKFLATMSHELRTPLNAILGNAELLSREHLANQTGARINDIHAAGQILISIINDILDLSKFDTVGIEFNEDIYDIADQLKRIHRMMQPKVKPGVRFVLEGTEQAIHINGDQNRLSQAILNLVSNAAKFTESGHITLRLICESEDLIIQVDDSGVGIAKEDAKNLFEDFVQVKKHANLQVEGTGLGLAITKRIVECMKGEIRLTSQEGVGSCFTIKLPIHILELNDQPKHKPTEITYEKCYDFSELNILIVDDVSMNCVILKALLEELGVTQIHEEYDGEDAVERIRQAMHFDMILMDIRMPKMDGLEASRLIRAMGYQKPIIAVTENAFEEDKQACLEAGMSAVLSKPIELDKLTDVLLSVSK